MPSVHGGGLGHVATTRVGLGWLHLARTGYAGFISRRLVRSALAFRSSSPISPPRLEHTNEHAR